jgi:hypothetical protein
MGEIAVVKSNKMLTIRGKSGRSRRGLSTLEMVLSLPILLFVTALLINFGTAACWKVRAAVAARHAVWRSRHDRSGQRDPHPAYWPNTAGLGTSGGGAVTVLDDPLVDQPVARGPLPYGCIVNDDLLDPTRGLRLGTADISRRPPLLAKMGPYRFDVRHPLLNDTWQYHAMGIPENRWRRIPFLYALPKATGLATAYVQAVLAIYYAPFRPALAPLDRDPEYIAYGMRFGWGGGAPDFHPRLASFCGLDHEVVDGLVKDLVDRIQGRKNPDVTGVPEHMGQAFKALYQTVINELVRQRDAKPPPPANVIAQINQEIAALQKKIDQLDVFLGGL